MQKTFDQNTVRRSVSLIVPIILEAIAHNRKKGIPDDIRQFLPKYMLTGVDSSAIPPYFTPVNLKDTGKRRLYINSSGHIIRYLTRKNLRSVYFELKATVPATSEKAFYSCFADRWVIISGSGHKTLSGWKEFIDSIFFIEAKPSKDNHPPCGVGKFTCIDDIIDRCQGSFRPDFMRPGARSVTVKLSSYELTLPETGDEKHDTSI